MTHKKCT